MANHLLIEINKSFFNNHLVNRGFTIHNLQTGVEFRPEESSIIYSCELIKVQNIQLHCFPLQYILCFDIL